MRALVSLVVLAAAAMAQPAPDQTVRQAIQRDRENRGATRNYTFVQREVHRNLDGKGALRSTDVRTFDVTLLAGSPYRRLIAIDDKPLPPAKAREEDEKLRKSIEARRKESETERSKRLAEEQKRWEESRTFLNEIPDAFDLTLAGSEIAGGRDCYVVAGTPRANYRPRTKAARLFPKIKGRLWIDKEDYSLIRAEVEAIETVSYGLILVRIHKGTRAIFEQTKVNGEVWLPLRLHAFAEGRLGLVKKLRVDYEVTYSDYKKFQVDSRIASVPEAPAAAK
jgi:hypothetical protein